jgi:hypothetical protein
MSDFSRSREHGRFIHIASERTYRKHSLHHFFYVVWRHRACVNCGSSIATVVRVMYRDTSSIVPCGHHPTAGDVYSHLLATGLCATIILFAWRKTTNQDSLCPGWGWNSDRHDDSEAGPANLDVWYHHALLAWHFNKPVVGPMYSFFILCGQMRPGNIRFLMISIDICTYIIQ